MTGSASIRNTRRQGLPIAALARYGMRMFELEKITIVEQIVKKSRFLTTAIPIADEKQAREAIAAHGHADANHNCWAWRVGQAYRFSDDGEPTGTAGKPILAAIDGQSVDKVAIVVTRWFGGVLLGTGGLVRAYGGGASACLRAGTLVPVIASISGSVALNFSELAVVKARLAAIADLHIIEERFTDTGAELVLHCPEQKAEAVSQLIADLTRGRAGLKLDE